MKKITSMLLLIAIITACAPLVYAQSVTDVVYEENFETGDFSVETNEENTVKEIKKGNDTVITFVKTDSEPFVDFPDESIVKLDETENTPLNNTMVLDTGTYYLSNDTDAYINFPQKYTSGTVTVDFRMRRLYKSNTNDVYFCASPISGASYDGEYVHRFNYMVDSSWRSRFRYYTSYVNENETQSISYVNVSAAKGYTFFRFVFDIDNQTVSSYYRTSTSGDYTLLGTENIGWYANGESGSYYMADGIASVLFTGQSYLSLDDIKITHTYESESAPAQEVENLAINADNGTFSASATLNYINSDITARLITATYDADGMLLSVKSGADTSVSGENPSADLAVESQTIPENTKYIKAYVWDFSTLKPYAVREYIIY